MGAKEAKRPSQIIGTLAHIKPTPTFQKQSLNEAFLRKWIKLDRLEHPGVRELQQAIGHFCNLVWKTPARGRLFVLAGPNGTGKTRCAMSVQRWLMHVGHAKKWTVGNRLRYIDCLFWRWAELLDTFKNGGWDALPDMFDATVLILDDVGAGHDPSQVGIDKLCQILSHREKKWTLLTTNIAPDAWEAKFDKRIESRLLRNSTIVDTSSVPDFNA